MQELNRIFSNGIAISLASNEAYAPYCAVVIYTLLKYGNPQREYDILILTKDMTDESKAKIKKLADGKENVSLRFIDMTNIEKALQSETDSYYSIETNYRLFLLSDFFAQYNRMIYLDCDMVVQGDISQLFDSDMNQKALAAAKDYTIDIMQLRMLPVFVGNTPYSVKNYCSQVLGMKTAEYYFNAGVLLFDLDTCRRKNITFEKAAGQLHQINYYYNDQDVLNILFEDSLYLLDTKWNYINGYQEYKREANGINHHSPEIIHYIGSCKPWHDSHVPLAQVYQKEWDAFLHLFGYLPNNPPANPAMVL